jgi:dTDP-4-dehydrorhamnose 3,5-epimerase
MINVAKVEQPILLKGKKHIDQRGFLMEVFTKKKIKFNFNRSISVFSKKNVIRGLHFQSMFAQHKIIFILKGNIKDVVVDIRKNKKSFGKVYSYDLEAGDTLIIPKGYAHGYSTFSNENMMIYFLSEDWYPKYETGIVWNDKTLGINWGIKRPIISKKDKILKNFSDL